MPVTRGGELTVVDPHFHLWDHATGNYAAPTPEQLASNHPRALDYRIGDYLADVQGVSLAGAVHVEAISIDPLRETRFVATETVRCPFPVGISAYANLTSDDLDRYLDAMSAASSKLCGVRQILSRHKDPALNFVDVDYMSHGAFVRGLRTLGRRNLIFELQLYPHQMARAAGAVCQAPETTVILNHAGSWDDRSSEGRQSWEQGLRLLADLPNVHAKISGLGKFDPDRTFLSYRDAAFEVFEAFGTKRSMFASNFPIEKPYGDYASLWQTFAAITDGFSNEERADVMRHNAAGIYRLAQADQSSAPDDDLSTVAEQRSKRHAS